MPLPVSPALFVDCHHLLIESIAAPLSSRTAGDPSRWTATRRAIQGYYRGVTRERSFTSSEHACKVVAQQAVLADDDIYGGDDHGEQCKRPGPSQQPGGAEGTGVSRGERRSWTDRCLPSQ